MSYMINHIHIKTDDPDKVAEWYAEAFGFEIISRRVRDFNSKLMDYFIAFAAAETKKSVAKKKRPQTGKTGGWLIKTLTRTLTVT